MYEKDYDKKWENKMRKLTKAQLIGLLRFAMKKLSALALSLPPKIKN